MIEIIDFFLLVVGTILLVVVLTLLIATVDNDRTLVILWNIIAVIWMAKYGLLLVMKLKKN